MVASASNLIFCQLALVLDVARHNSPATHFRIKSNIAYSHGKDNKLIVWKLSEEDEASMSVVLPVDTPPEPRKLPWVLHILHVNTMNFCSFAQTEIKASSDSESETEDELLIAVPNTMSSETVCSPLHDLPFK